MHICYYIRPRFKHICYSYDLGSSIFVITYDLVLEDRTAATHKGGRHIGMILLVIARQLYTLASTDVHTPISLLGCGNG
jgi:hypothetical protein